MTPRELVHIATVAREERWNHTASLLWMIHGILAKDKKRVDEFHPMKLKAKAKPADMSLAEFKLLYQAMEGVTVGCSGRIELPAVRARGAG